LFLLTNAGSVAGVELLYFSLERREKAPFER
jgi:hypothetical protein